MDKVLVKLIVPVLAGDYDVWIPKCLRIGEIIDLLIKSLDELSKKQYKRTGEEVLCRVKSHSIMNYGTLLEQYDIENGEVLVLL